MISKHNKKSYVAAGIVIFIAAVAAIAAYIMMPRGKPVVLQTDELYYILKDGDIICRLGDRFWSQHFKNISVTDKRYSHMGIIRINNGRITVIHSEGDTGHGRDYVNEISLKEFIEIARAIGIYRINDLDGSLLSNTALEYLGVPFDWQFDLNDNSKLYCTELLYVILKRLKPELELSTVFIKQLEKNIIPLDAISASNHFNEVYFLGNYTP